jgi:hypothetical protein
MIDYLPLRLGNYPQDRGTRPALSGPGFLKWDYPLPRTYPFMTRT